MDRVRNGEAFLKKLLARAGDFCNETPPPVLQELAAVSRPSSIIHPSQTTPITKIENRSRSCRTSATASSRQGCIHGTSGYSDNTDPGTGDTAQHLGSRCADSCDRRDGPACLRRRAAHGTVG